MNGNRALVIGGSLAGLFTGVLLRAAGWHVEIFERSAHEMDSRGGGIVLQPEVLEAFRLAGIRYDGTIGVEAKERVFLDRSGGIADRIPMRQILTSWTLVYTELRRAFPDRHYHRGHELIDFVQSGGGVVARFRDGRTVDGDLLVGADGSRSKVREIVLPSVRAEYAGYVAWRGLVDEADLAVAASTVLVDRFVFYDYPNSHMLSYLVPGANENVQPGSRRFNWVWYRNHSPDTLQLLLTDDNGRRRSLSVAPGSLSLAAEENVRTAADRFLPHPFKQLVAATKKPFVQAIIDLSVPRMAFGRVALVGDSAFVPRPHTAASTSKAASNAISLAKALRTAPGGVEKVLAEWEPAQLELGSNLREVGRKLGDRTQKVYPLNTPT
jgi:2-polyprenyl-6-methoxyphenol hydroxylase-like FAD-dependent oxidoreductase